MVHALRFFQGSPRKIIFDNLKAAVLSGSGRYACLHPEFLALCGHFCMEPIACASRDPESKGTVEGGVRYVKRNALAGRSEELATWEDYRRLAPRWRDEVANVRLHAATKERPMDRFQKERDRLRPLPAIPFDTDEILPVVVTPHARVHYDGNRYSVPPALVRKPVTLRANATEVRILDQGQEVARHTRCYEKGQLLRHPDHHLAALKMRRRRQADQRQEEFDALGTVAREFHLKLLSMPVKPTVHLRRLLGLVRLYGRKGSSMLDVLAALIGEEVAVRRERALQRRLHHAHLPKQKTLQEYDFTFPKRIPKQAILRLFDTPPRNFSSSMSWAICPSTNAVRTCCSRSRLPATNVARSWSPPTEPSGTGARSLTWTTPWPPP